MVLMAVLGAFLAAGLVAIWRWGHLDVVVPWETENATWPLPPRRSLHRYVWYVTVGVTSGLASGVVIFGAGGRLAMRLLAVTAGADAQGLVTEADQVVGQITLAGTLGFIGFFGILIGTFVGLLYMLVRRWLPRGRWGGVTFGLLLLILVATRMDPLRPENPDFELVGPGWLAVAVFSAVVVGYGMLLAALAGRYSRSLPLLKRDLRTIAKYVPAYVIFGPAFLVLVIPLTVVGLFAILFARTDGLDRILASKRTLLAGRALGIAVAAIAAPGFVLSIADIVGRS